MAKGDKVFAYLQDGKYCDANLWRDILGDDFPDDLRTAGGAGSGNFGHAGRPGEVGGSAPAESGPLSYGILDKLFGAKPSAGVSPAVKERIARIATRRGVDPSRIEIKPKSQTVKVGNTEWTEAGHYDPATGKITLIEEMATNPDDVAGFLSHEITHADWQTVFTAIAGGTDNAKAKEFLAEVEKHLSELKEKDGITEYSTAYWNAAKDERGTALAVNETLAEMSRLMEQQQADKVDPVWQGLYFKLLVASKSLSGKTSA